MEMILGTTAQSNKGKWGEGNRELVRSLKDHRVRVVGVWLAISEKKKPRDERELDHLGKERQKSAKVSQPDIFAQLTLRFRYDCTHYCRVI